MLLRGLYDERYISELVRSSQGARSICSILSQQFDQAVGVQYGTDAYRVRILLCRNYSLTINKKLMGRSRSKYECIYSYLVAHCLANLLSSR